MFAQALAIAKKDLQVFVADRKAMLISFIVPIAIACFFSFVMGGAAGSGQPTTKLKVLVVEEDGGTSIRPLLRAIESRTCSSCANFGKRLHSGRHYIKYFDLMAVFEQVLHHGIAHVA